MTRGAYKGMGGLIPEFYGILLIIDSIMPQEPRFHVISSVVQNVANLAFNA